MVAQETPAGKLASPGRATQYLLLLQPPVQPACMKSLLSLQNIAVRKFEGGGGGPAGGGACLQMLTGSAGFESIQLLKAVALEHM